MKHFYSFREQSQKKPYNKKSKAIANENWINDNTNERYAINRSHDNNNNDVIVIALISSN